MGLYKGVGRLDGDGWGKTAILGIPIFNWGVPKMKPDDGWFVAHSLLRTIKEMAEFPAFW